MSDKHSDKQQAGSQSESSASVDRDKRKFLIATSAVGALGCAAAAVPFITSMTPSERAKAAGAPVEVDISKVAPGEMMTTEWRGKRVWIINRTDEMRAEWAKHNGQLSNRSCDVIAPRPSHGKS